jgi:hypothetical protein
MSPEQALERVLDPRSDLFSLGTLLFHLVTGQLPFTGTNPSIILRNIIEGNRRDVLDVQPGVAPLFADVVDRLMEPQPDARFDTARAVELALIEVVHDVGLDQGPNWDLPAYLCDPDDYEDRLKERLDDVLLKGGRAALRAGDHLIAQRMFNRLLAQDPHHEEVLTLLSDLHQYGPGTDPSDRRVAGLGGALLVFCLGFGAWWWMVPQDAALPDSWVSPEPSSSFRSGPQAMRLDELVLAPRPRPGRPPATIEATPIGEPSGAVRLVPARVARTQPVEEPPGVSVEAEPSGTAPEPAWVVVTLGKKGYADVFIDGEKVGMTPLTGTTFETTAGRHDLMLRNPAGEDFPASFEVEAGQTAEFLGVLLERRPITVSFGETLEDDCTVAQDGRELGTILAVGRTLVPLDSDRPHDLEIRCPSGFNTVKKVGRRDAGKTVYMGPPP